MLHQSGPACARLQSLSLTGWSGDDRRNIEWDFYQRTMPAQRPSYAVVPEPREALLARFERLTELRLSMHCVDTEVRRLHALPALRLLEIECTSPALIARGGLPSAEAVRRLLAARVDLRARVTCAHVPLTAVDDVALRGVVGTRRAVLDYLDEVAALHRQAREERSRLDVIEVAI